MVSVGVPMLDEEKEVGRETEVTTADEFGEGRAALVAEVTLPATGVDLPAACFLPRALDLPTAEEGFFGGGTLSSFCCEETATRTGAVLVD